MATQWSRQPPDAWVKQGDRSPSIAFQLLDGLGAPVVLTGATVKFIMQAPGAASAKVNASATVTDAALGKVSYAWASLDTDTIGAYLAEWQVTYSGGLVESFPNGGHLKVMVLDDVGS